MQTPHFTIRLNHPRQHIIDNDVDKIGSNLNPEHSARLRLLREYNLRQFDTKSSTTVTHLFT
jgi:hypothetical protein